MRRKPGALLPLEEAILVAALKLHRSRAPEFHGYQIAKHLAEDTTRRSLTAYGTLYRALGRLESMGMLESRWEDPQIAADENRPGRRLYVITGRGMVAARAPTKAPGFLRLARPRRKRVAPA
jgi:DNA-binding PadR family transcriptional regulator